MYVPNSPSSYFQYFPTGCYTICRQQIPLTLYGPPDVIFANWKWIYNGLATKAGGGIMLPDTITTQGAYKWSLNNGYCTQKSGDMDIWLVNCNMCGNPPVVKISCTPGNPACYQMAVTLFCLTPGTTFTIGTNMGPMTPFSGVLTTGGSSTMIYTFTTMIAPPANINVEVHFTLPSGKQCFQKVSVKIPYCGWVTERAASNDSATTAIADSPALNNISNAMLVYPNPTSGALAISYSFGDAAYKERSICIYDAMGRKTEALAPADIQGSWSLNTSAWMPGVYIIRMEADGQALQTQRVVVAH